MEKQIKKIGDFSEPLFQAAFHECGYVKTGIIKASDQQSIYIKDLAESGVASQ